jgi:hypothetical protein
VLAFGRVLWAEIEQSQQAPAVAIEVDNIDAAGILLQPGEQVQILLQGEHDQGSIYASMRHDQNRRPAQVGGQLAPEAANALQQRPKGFASQET